MKRNLIIIPIIILSLSCSTNYILSFIRPGKSIDEVLKEKDKIDKANNPAYVRVILDDLSGRRDEAIRRYREAIDADIEGAGMELAKKYLKDPYRGGDK